MKFLSATVSLMGMISGLLAAPLISNTSTLDVTAIMDYINVARSSAGVTNLTYSDIFTTDAYHQVQYLNQIRQLTHDNPAGNLTARLENQGHALTYAEENLALGDTNEAGVVKAWLANPDTRVRLLDPRACQVGVAHLGRYWAQAIGCLVGPATTSTTPTTTAAAASDSVSTTPLASTTPIATPTTTPTPTTTSSTTTPTSSTSTSSTTTTTTTTTTSSTPSSTPTSPPPSTDNGSNTANQQLVLDLVNGHRADAGLSPLVLSTSLTQLALAQSVYQKSIDTMTHDNPAGSLGTRATAAGIKWANIGENVFRGPQTEQAAVDGWMDSTGHRANILGASYTAMGIARVGDFWTQNFAELR
ncbi:CAP domain-containing protein [Dimargaris cristalligena]|uniref:CAP domain-containing protein n=1 Tax=Dimargaris cristalligena TaxID=215637 RepID=A0A4P9ZVB2_9FUNG|nr:CAP domain-containing protein [Dimargaris cristalligena]|eukprot:RKP37534.1 CAP domain-containing protein [Dimargaris cristalligena]